VQLEDHVLLAAGEGRDDGAELGAVVAAGEEGEVVVVGEGPRTTLKRPVPSYT
jgi:hypothetical protein